MMVDDDDVGFGGPLAHSRDETLVIAGTLRPEAGISGGGDLVPEGHVFRKIFELASIAGLRLRRPLPDDREKHVVRNGSCAVAQLIETMEAHVIRTALHAGRRERNAKRLAQRWNVLEEDLFLKVLGPRGDQYALTAEDSRDEIRERLARTSAGLREQDAPVSENGRDSCRHVHLPVPRLEVRDAARQRSVRRKNRSDLGRQTAQAGYNGNF